MLCVCVCVCVCVCIVYISVYFILKSPPKESTSITLVIQMRKLRHRAVEFTRERELDVGWGGTDLGGQAGQSSHPHLAPHLAV